MSERIVVALGERSYDILVGTALLDGAGTQIASLARGVIPVVTDTHVAPLYLDRLVSALGRAGVAAEPIVLPAGEGTKSFSQLERLCSMLLKTGVERGGLIIALGGGVIGDLTGLAAGLLKRGIDFAQFPTTLLAQVDSSVGGKTAINSPEGKNLIGAFHQPLLVIADTDSLLTLPPRELKAGYAEIVKYGLLGDPTFFEWLEKNGAAVLSGDPAALVHAIATSCRAKAKIVEADEREEGQRALLNLGHTFAHALEAESGFGADFNHGEAVSVGMALAFDLSVRLGYCPPGDLMRVRSHLARHGLPVSPPRGFGFAPPALIARMQQDKKAERGRLTFVLARGIGQAFVAKGVERSAVESALANALAA